MDASRFRFARRGGFLCDCNCLDSVIEKLKRAFAAAAIFVAKLCVIEAVELRANASPASHGSDLLEPTALEEIPLVSKISLLLLLDNAGD